MGHAPTTSRGAPRSSSRRAQNAPPGCPNKPPDKPTRRVRDRRVDGTAEKPHRPRVLAIASTWRAPIRHPASHGAGRNVTVAGRARSAVMHYLDDREVAAQIGAREPAVGGTFLIDLGNVLGRRSAHAREHVRVRAQGGNEKRPTRLNNSPAPARPLGYRRAKREGARSEWFTPRSGFGTIPQSASPPPDEGSARTVRTRPGTWRRPK